jgi:hypothetical protein
VTENALSRKAFIGEANVKIDKRKAEERSKESDIQLRDMFAQFVMLSPEIFQKCI